MSTDVDGGEGSSFDCVEIGKNHRVRETLGEGGYGLVTKCININTGKMEAIKVNKSHPQMFYQAKQEIAIMKQLQCLDPDTCHIVKWNGFFFHKEHICLNFELLDQSLADYLDDGNNEGIRLTELGPIIHQLATALSHLRSNGIIHADIKPDNVMIVDRQQHPQKVKLIDFGLAHPKSAANNDRNLQTTWYRAPEVMLGLPYDESIDMWSLGLVAAELATGYPLYAGAKNYDVLRYITETQGQPPDYLLDCGRYTEKYFKKESNRNECWRLKTPEEFETETGYISGDPWFHKLSCLDDLVKHMIEDKEQMRVQLLFVDLIKRMLQLDPDQRIQPQGVLEHPFITQSLIKSVHPDDEATNTDWQTSSCETAESENIDWLDASAAINGVISIGKCHELRQTLREDSYSRIVKCLNINTGKMEAIKVNKSHPQMFYQAKQEIAIMKQLRCLDPDMCHIVKWNGFFFHKEHICLNFELLDQSLADYLDDGNNEGIRLTELGPIIHQLARALSHLRSNGIIHADIKPDNVMIVDRQQHPQKVKLIDFGLAHPKSAANHDRNLQTTWYRAPEVMLGLPYDESIDMWSLGLVAAELATGYPLYAGAKNYDVLRYITETQGQPPDYLLDCGRYTEKYFKKESNRNECWRLKTPEEFEIETGYFSKESRYIKLSCLDDLEQHIGKDNEIGSDRVLLVDLIKKMIQLDPGQRMKPVEVLEHRFIAQSLRKSSHPKTGMEIINTDEEMTDRCQQSSSCEKEDSHAAVSQIVRQNNKSANPGDPNNGKLKPPIRSIRDALCDFFTVYG